MILAELELQFPKMWSIPVNSWFKAVLLLFHTEPCRLRKPVFPNGWNHYLNCILFNIQVCFMIWNIKMQQICKEVQIRKRKYFFPALQIMRHSDNSLEPDFTSVPCISCEVCIFSSFSRAFHERSQRVGPEFYRPQVGFSRLAACGHFR